MRARRELCIAGMVLGVLLLASPLLGLLGGGAGTSSAFARLGETGIGHLEALANDLGLALLSTVAGLFLLPIGIIVLTVSSCFIFRFAARMWRPRSRPRRAVSLSVGCGLS